MTEGSDVTLASELGTGQVFWSMLWFFLFFIWIWILITVFADLFRSHDLSGWAKAAWVIFVIIVPFLGVFIYLITQNAGMTERGLERANAQQAAYGAPAGGGGGGAAAEIESGKKLLDSGAITSASLPIATAIERSVGLSWRRKAWDALFARRSCSPAILQLRSIPSTTVSGNSPAANAEISCRS